MDALDKPTGFPACSIWRAGFIPFPYIFCTLSRCICELKCSRFLKHFIWHVCDSLLIRNIFSIEQKLSLKLDDQLTPSEQGHLLFQYCVKLYLINNLVAPIVLYRGTEDSSFMVSNRHIASTLWNQSVKRGEAAGQLGSSSTGWSTEGNRQNCHS